MKRIISFLTVFSLLAATFAMAAMPISAEVNNHYDDSLVSWWNFEGDTEAEQKQDKAKNGAAVDDASFFNVSVSDGNATVTSDIGSYITLPNKGDMANMNEKTFYMAFRLVGEKATASTNVIYANGFLRYWTATNSTPTNYGHSGGIGTGATSASAGKFSFVTGTPKVPNEDGWMHLAVSFSFDATNVTAKVYVSNDGVNYVLSENVKEQSVAGVTSKMSNAMWLGKTNSTKDIGGGMGVVYKEIRLYDEVLSAEAISGLAAHTPYSSTETLPELKPVEGLLDANLVSYYDFKGTTADEQIADKAPNGSENDALTIAGEASVSNETVVIPSSVGSYVSIPNTGDFANVNGKTFYMVYSIDRTSTPDNGYANDLISMGYNGKVFRYYSGVQSSATSYALGGKVANVTTYSPARGTPICPTDSWYYIAVSFELVDGRLATKIYNSANGSDYVKTEFDVVGVSESALTLDTSVLLGKTRTDIDDRGIELTVNEIRIYDKALAENEVKVLSQVTPMESPVNVLGFQERLNDESNLLDVRFLAHLNVTEADLERFSEVGFEISATFNGVTKSTKVIGSQKVYNTIKADNEDITIGSYDHVDGYIVALPVYNVPVSGTVTFTVKPYCISGGVTQYGETVTATYTDGAPVV